MDKLQTLEQRANTLLLESGFFATFRLPENLSISCEAILI
jgi:hypothetical protein